MRSAVALLLVASVAAAEPPVSNPPPTPESFEFPQENPPPVTKKGVHKAVFFTCAAGTIAALALGIAMGFVSQGDARTGSSDRAETESFVSTGAYIGSLLLLVASLLLIPVTRWNE